MGPAQAMTLRDDVAALAERVAALEARLGVHAPTRELTAGQRRMKEYLEYEQDLTTYAIALFLGGGGWITLDEMATMLEHRFLSKRAAQRVARTAFDRTYAFWRDTALHPDDPRIPGMDPPVGGAGFGDR